MPNAEWDRGIAAVEQMSWEAAVDLLMSALDRSADPTAEHLEALASAAWWLNDVDTAIAARERGFTLATAAGNDLLAGKMAFDLAFDNAVKSRPSVSRSWLARAEQIAARHPDDSLSGHIERLRARSALERDGDADAALDHAEQAIAAARATGDYDLEMLAIHDRGQILTSLGRVDEGIGEMERAMVAAATGELSAETTGKIYCNMIAACLDVADFGTAAEWSEEAERWCDAVSNEGGYPGICRVRRSEVNRRRGLLDAAHAGAEQAASELQHFVPYAAAAITEMGNVHLLRGDFEAAEREFLRAHAMGHDPMPGMAQLRLAQDRADEAAALIGAALAAHPTAQMQRLRLLPAAVEIYLGAGEESAAAECVDEYSRIGAHYRAPALRATESFLRGLLDAARDDHDAAMVAFRTAAARWLEAGLPYDAARARAALGRSLVASGRQAAGELELSAAAADFERLGTRVDLSTVRTQRGPMEDRGEVALDLLQDLPEIVVARYSIVGGYTRFSEGVRNVLTDARQRIVSGLLGSGGNRENHLLWAAPGSGKTFFVEEIARSLEGVEFVELNLARLGETEMRSGLDDAASTERPVLVLLDEIDARGDEGWPYGLLLPYLDRNAKRDHPIVFVMAGSGGVDLSDFLDSIRRRPKGSDLLSRTPETNIVQVAGLEIGDQVLVAVSHLVGHARREGKTVEAVERSALYYIAVTDYLRNARQLAEFSARAAQRMPVGETRVKFDHLFAAGDPENKAFWARLQDEARSLESSFVVVAA